MVKLAICHEGHTKKSLDSEIIKLLLKDLKLDINRVEFYGFGSKSNFFKKDYKVYQNLQMAIKEQEIEKILFVLDADNEEDDHFFGGYVKTSRGLRTILSDLKLSSISDSYISCNPTEKIGNIESLLLSTIPQEQKECIDDFLQCSEFKAKGNDKALLKQIYKLAYPDTPYNFKHKHFDELKTKLQNLFVTK
jgi:hypothetical protein